MARETHARRRAFQRYRQSLLDHMTQLYALGTVPGLTTVEGDLVATDYRWVNPKAEAAYQTAQETLRWLDEQVAQARQEHTGDDHA